MVETPAIFADTRIVRTGGVAKDELLRRLRHNGIRMNTYADRLFADPDFATTPVPHDVRVVFVSMAEIGLPDGGRYREILAHAASKGLEPCPLELAPHLRLDYRDQPEGPYLTVASAERSPDPDTPNGFYIRHLDGELWLRGYESGPENAYAPDFSRFVFLHP